VSLLHRNLYKSEEVGGYRRRSLRRGSVREPDCFNGGRVRDHVKLHLGPVMLSIERNHSGWFDPCRAGHKHQQIRFMRRTRSGGDYAFRG